MWMDKEEENETERNKNCLNSADSRYLAEHQTRSRSRSRSFSLISSRTYVIRGHSGNSHTWRGLIPSFFFLLI